jgi:DNA-binding NarL/FixJ family response regulator
MPARPLIFPAPGASTRVDWARRAILYLCKFRSDAIRRTCAQVRQPNTPKMCSAMDIDLNDSQATHTPKGILVVDDHELLRFGLRTLVESHAQANGHVVAVFEARSLKEALEVYGHHAAAIQMVLLDLHLPDAHGLLGVSAFMGQYPDAHLVVLSGASDPGLQRDALTMGASAYLAKAGDLDQVVQYIAAMDLIRPATPSLPATSPPSPGGRSVRTASGDWVQLSARQAQVLDWILTGWSNRQIADHANLTEGTVKNHVSTLLLLLGARSRAQLISQLR